MFFSSIRKSSKRPAPSALYTTRRSDSELEFAVEGLEARKMLAGNVTASVRAGDLILSGDNFSNNIDIVATGFGIRVIGLADPNGAATTVNGLAFADFSGPNLVQDDLRITMRGGQDRVGVFLTVNDDVTANMGSGGDSFNVSALIGGRLNVNMGSAENLAADFVNIINTRVVDTANISGGGGSQIFFVSNSQFDRLGNFSLGGGDDYLEIQNSAFTQFRANGGGGRADQFVAQVSPAVRGFEIIV